MEPTDQPNPKTTSETDVINPKESNSDKFEESLSVIDSRLLKTGDYQLHVTKKTKK